MKNISKLRRVIDQKISIELSLMEYIDFVYQLAYTYICMDRRDVKIQKKYIMKLLMKFVSQVDILEIVRTNPGLTIKIYTISACLKELGLINNIIYPDKNFLEEKELGFKEYLNLKILDFRYNNCLSCESTVKYQISKAMNDYITYPELICYQKLNNLWRKCDEFSITLLAKDLVNTKKYEDILRLFFVEDGLKQLVIDNWDEIIIRSSLMNLLLLEVKLFA